MMVMEHQYLLTEQIPEVVAWSEEHGKKLPLIRDVDVSYYLRQEKGGYNLGPYEPNCKAHWEGGDAEMPDDFSFQLWQEDLDRIEDIVTDAMERVPLMATTGVSSVINGPIPYAPDGLPLIGPMPGVIMPSRLASLPLASPKAVAPARSWPNGSSMAQQNGICGPSIRAATPTTPITTTAWPKAWKSTATNTPCTSHGIAGPPHLIASCQPYTPRQAAGGQMGATTAGSAPIGSLRTATTPPKKAPTHGVAQALGNSASAKNAKPCATVAVFWPSPGFTRLAVEGTGARAHVAKLTCSRLPAAGRVGLAYFPDSRGRILSEMSVIPRDDDNFWLITAASRPMA